MILGFTGTRHGMSPAQCLAVTRILGLVRSDTSEAHHFHDGMCVGADNQAAEMAEILEFTTIGHPGPKGRWQSLKKRDQVWAPKTHFARNRDIVNLAQLVIAAPFEQTEQETGGTWYTIRYAKKRQVPLLTIYPDGKQEWSLPAWATLRLPPAILGILPSAPSKLPSM